MLNFDWEGFRTIRFYLKLSS
uniref:Uncharacterized protein n=1 Tax=Rhizophora mucronata TaxID=61149 RepID=A0A2P2P7N1_RHIMU